MHVSSQPAPARPAASLPQCVGRCLLHLLLIGSATWAAASSYGIVLIGWQFATSDQWTLKEVAIGIPTILMMTTLAVSIIIVPTFVLSQALLGVVLFLFCRRLSIGNLCALAVSVLLLSLVSFECFDYFVPSWSGPDGTWVHGLTGRRLAVFLGLQSFLAAFSVWRLSRTRQRRPGIGAPTG